MDNSNIYGDALGATRGKFGTDIATQRADDLDEMSLLHIGTLQVGCRALDAACAAGGQAIRMAAAGANVTCLDIQDYSDEVHRAATAAGVADRCHFQKVDLIGYEIAANHPPFDLIVCQRMIHYLPFLSALEVVKAFHKALAPDGALYISASGIGSELGNNYLGVGVPLVHRYTELDADMAAKHDIRGPVCLFSENDLAFLLKSAGFQQIQVFTSPFGNVKAVAR